MSPSLSSPYLTLELAGHGTWSVESAGLRLPVVGSGRIFVSWRDQAQRRCESLALDPDAISTDRRADSPLGSVLVASTEERLGPEGMHVHVEFGICLDLPLLIWRARVRNPSRHAVQLERVGFLEHGEAGVPVSWGGREADTGGPTSRDQLSFYTNGWQSWGYAGTLLPSDRAPATRLGPFTLPRINPSTPRPRGRGRFASDMFGVVCHRGLGTAVVAGFLSQQAAFGSLLADLRHHPLRLRMWEDLDGVRLDPGAVFDTDWAALQFADLRQPEPIGPYLEAVARLNRARQTATVPVGWCSWYFWFEKITQQGMLDNLAWADAHREAVPLDLIQLDDGYETQVGDWTDLQDTFPEGPAELRRRIQAAGFRPGLWLAPYIVKPQARALSDHPDWVLRDVHGAPVNAGFAWNVFTRALDVTNPAVLDHVDALIRTVVGDWGFGYLKLDFLYAAALPGARHDPTLTRAQALRKALERVRAAAGSETTLVGCGCPLGPAIGIVDSMRIGTDVAPRWEPAFLGLELPFRREPDFPAARSAARNALTRSMLHRKWWVNDPDCLLVREARSGSDPGGPAGSGTRLTSSETQFLATVVALSAGSLIVSDDLPRLSAERSGWLARLIPPLPQAAHVADLFDAAYPATAVLPLEGAGGAWHLVALLNWADRPADLHVDLLRLGLPDASAYHAVDFWGERYRRIDSRSLLLSQVGAHTAIVLAVRPVTLGPCWLGDSLHISQGLGLTSWQNRGTELSARLALGRVARGAAWIALPASPSKVHLDGRAVAAAEDSPGVFRLELEVHNTGRLEIRWA